MTFEECEKIRNEGSEFYRTHEIEDKKNPYIVDTEKYEWWEVGWTEEYVADTTPLSDYF